MPPGFKAGGRTKGTPNKKNAEVSELLASMNCNSIEGMARIAIGKVPCKVCHGKRKTKYQPLNGAEPGIRTCQSCWGSGLEQISPELSGKMYAELAQYQYAKRKALDLKIGVDEKLDAAIMDERFSRHRDKP